MQSSVEPLVINCSFGEGGGAMFRTAIVLSALSQIPIRLHSIRGALRRKGLNSEDLTLLTAMSASCRAEVIGDNLDSNEVMFIPHRNARALRATFDVGAFEKGNVPGAATVILQSLIPALARSGAYSSVRIIGETHAKNILGFDAMEQSTLYALRQQGICAFTSLAQAGYGTGSPGEMTLDIEPSKPNSVDWTSRGNTLGCGAVISYSGIPESIIERGLARLRERLAEVNIEADVWSQEVPSKGTGVSITIWAQCETGCGTGQATGERGLRIESVVDSAFSSFKEWFCSDAAVDQYLADQMLLPAVLAEGKTTITTQLLTRRLISMAWLVKQFIPVQIMIKGEEGYPGTITIER